MENLTYAIDISHHNVINWDELPAYVKVVLVKATEGIGYTDPSFEAHVEGALGSGRLVVPYHFYRTFVSGVKSDPVGQAEWFAERTKAYWSDFGGRANDFERSGTYNPFIETANEDLQAFHSTLHQSAWQAFDLLYSSIGSWSFFGLHNLNFWQGPKWITEQPWLDGLWLAWWPADRPTSEADLASFGAGEVPSKYYPRPFKEHIVWQVGSDFVMPGSYNKNGEAKLIDFDIFPYPLEEVQKLFGAFEQPEPEADPLLDVLQRIDQHQASMAASLAIIAGQQPDPGDGSEDPGGEDPQDDPHAWLNAYTWPTDWTSGWDTPAKSTDKALWEIVGTPESNPYRLRIPFNPDGTIRRNDLGGIQFVPDTDAPLVHDGQRFWGFKEQTLAGSESNGGAGVILIGDRNRPGHEFYAISPGRTRLVATYINGDYQEK
jgi:hypothetical protein